jgi:hypothetical protein
MRSLDAVTGKVPEHWQSSAPVVPDGDRIMRLPGHTGRTASNRTEKQCAVIFCYG